MLLALSDITYVLIGWFNFLLLKFPHEYGPRDAIDTHRGLPLVLNVISCISYTGKHLHNEIAGVKITKCNAPLT